MEQTIAAVESAIAQLTQRVDLCARYIRLLTGYPQTQQFRVQFFEQDGIDALVIDVADADIHFIMQFFMSWHLTYQRRLEQHKRALSIMMTARLTEGQVNSRL